MFRPVYAHAIENDMQHGGSDLLSGIFIILIVFVVYTSSWILILLHAKYEVGFQCVIWLFGCVYSLCMW